MTAHECFVDSNIIIYAHDQQEKTKQPIAKKLFGTFWDSNPLYPNISIQVLQECFAALIRKKIPFNDASGIIELYSRWNIIDNDKNILLEGLHIQHKYRISVWDAFIISAAKKARAKYILTEDLNPQQTYEGIKAINPFLHPNHCLG